jgi:hypothetical protein
VRFLAAFIAFLASRRNLAFRIPSESRAAPSVTLPVARFSALRKKPGVFIFSPE